MENAVCTDGRARGLLQFYGANRTGRFAGRLIQVQNLPQNHLLDLKQARRLVRGGHFDALEILYDSIPGVLSELIRTAFVPKKGYKFIVADFSAIEARVIAWLAGETWRNEVFANGGDIYCASASQMFNVPVEKNGVNGHLRQKGKQAELACIAHNSLVLTDKGLVPIQDITTKHKLWDGEDWVKHDGVISKGGSKGNRGQYNLEKLPPAKHISYKPEMVGEQYGWGKIISAQKRWNAKMNHCYVLTQCTGCHSIQWQNLTTEEYQ